MSDRENGSTPDRRRWRDAFLLLLTFSSGVVDVVAYLGLGRIFTANMTGNTVFLAIGLGDGNILTATRSVAAIFGFAFGAYLAGRYLGPLKEGAMWPATATIVLWGEVALLGAFAALWAVWDGSPGGSATFVLLGLSSIGMGMQSAVGRRISVPGLTTNVLTMALTGLMAELAALGISGSDSRRWAAAIVCMGAGAASGAALYDSARPFLPILPLVTVLLVCVLASHRGPALDGRRPDGRRETVSTADAR